MWEKFLDVAWKIKHDLYWKCTPWGRRRAKNVSKELEELRKRLVGED